jgi:GNAT superfamily N-acetyltransferase
MSDVVVRPLTPGRWDDLVELFGRRGAAIPGRCWCMYYRQPGAGRSAETNKPALRSLVGSPVAPGLIAYVEGSAAGWISLGPRDAYPGLRRSPVAKQFDDDPTWSIVCFFVDRALRGRGIADRLLKAGLDYARSKGAERIEACPVDREAPFDNEMAFVGAKPMFDHAGFIEIARRRPTRPLMRKELSSEG